MAGNVGIRSDTYYAPPPGAAGRPVGLGGMAQGPAAQAALPSGNVADWTMLAPEDIGSYAKEDFRAANNPRIQAFADRFLGGYDPNAYNEMYKNWERYGGTLGNLDRLSQTPLFNGLDLTRLSPEQQFAIVREADIRYSPENFYDQPIGDSGETQRVGNYERFRYGPDKLYLDYAPTYTPTQTTEGDTTTTGRVEGEKKWQVTGRKDYGGFDKRLGQAGSNLMQVAGPILALLSAGTATPLLLMAAAAQGASLASQRGGPLSGDAGRWIGTGLQAASGNYAGAAASALNNYAQATGNTDLQVLAGLGGIGAAGYGAYNALSAPSGGGNISAPAQGTTGGQDMAGPGWGADYDYGNYDFSTPDYTSSYSSSQSSFPMSLGDMGYGQQGFGGYESLGGTSLMGGSNIPSIGGTGYSDPGTMSYSSTPSGSGPSFGGDYAMPTFDWMASNETMRNGPAAQQASRARMPQGVGYGAMQGPGGMSGLQKAGAIASLVKTGLGAYSNYQQQKALESELKRRKRSQNAIENMLENPQSIYENDPGLQQMRTARLDSVKARQLAKFGGTEGGAYARDIMSQGAMFDRAALNDAIQARQGIVASTQYAPQMNAQFGGTGLGALSSAATGGANDYLFYNYLLPMLMQQQKQPGQ